MFSAHVLSPQFNDSITDLDRATTIHGGNAHGGSTYSGANAAGSSGGNWSILVVDAQRIRRVTFPAAYAQIFWGKQARFREEAINHTTTFGHSNLHGIRSCGMVRTVAGQAIEGDKDGQGSDIILAAADVTDGHSGDYEGARDQLEHLNLRRHKKIEIR